MNLKSIRKIAAGILKTGESKVWIDSGQTGKAKEAITKEDIRDLIKKGIIKEKHTSFQSKGRARILQRQKKKGRKKGFGKRKGTFNARMKKKQTWVKKVRALRSKLKELRKNGELKEGQFKHFYSLIKGNYFRGKKHIEETAKAGKETDARAGKMQALVFSL